MTSLSPLSRHHLKRSWLRVGSRKPGSAEFGRGGDQRLQLLVALGRGMSKEADRRSVAGDPPEMLDDDCLVRADRLGELLGAAFEAVDMPADRVARDGIRRRRRANLVAGEAQAKRRALDHRSGSRAAKPSRV